MKVNTIGKPVGTKSFHCGVCGTDFTFTDDSIRKVIKIAPNNDYSSVSHRVRCPKCMTDFTVFSYQERLKTDPSMDIRARVLKEGWKRPYYFIPDTGEIYADLKALSRAYNKAMKLYSNYVEPEVDSQKDELEDLLNQITPENIPAEGYFGIDVGKEILEPFVEESVPEEPEHSINPEDCIVTYKDSEDNPIDPDIAELAEVVENINEVDDRVIETQGYDEPEDTVNGSEVPIDKVPKEISEGILDE